MQVLLVEDEDVVSLFLRLELQDIGIYVDAHSTAADALNACEWQHYDAAIFDVGLPDMRGDELARRCRARDPLLPIIVATAMRRDETQLNFAADPRIQFLEKPFEVDQLIEALRKCDIGPGEPRM